MRPPVTPTKLFIFIFILVVLLLIIQIGIFTIVLEKLGLSAHSAMTLLIVTLIGSGINLPISEIDILDSLARSTAADTAAELVPKAVKNGARDNITAVVVKMKSMGSCC